MAQALDDMTPSKIATLLRASRGHRGAADGDVEELDRIQSAQKPLHLPNPGFIRQWVNSLTQKNLLNANCSNRRDSAR